MLHYVCNIKRGTNIPKQITNHIQYLNKMVFIVGISSIYALKPTDAKPYFGPMLKLYLP